MYHQKECEATTSESKVLCVFGDLEEEEEEEDGDDYEALAAKQTKMEKIFLFFLIAIQSNQSITDTF